MELRTRSTSFLSASLSFPSLVWPYGAQCASQKQLQRRIVFPMNTIEHYISIWKTFNEEKRTLSRCVCTHTNTHTHKHTHMHTQNNATSSPPQIILSNSSLTPAVREHFPRVGSHNQTTEGDQSTRKTKLTKRSLCLSLSALLSHSSFPWRPKVLCHLLATLGNAFFKNQLKATFFFVPLVVSIDLILSVSLPLCLLNLSCYCYIQQLLTAKYKQQNDKVEFYLMPITFNRIMYVLFDVLPFLDSTFSVTLISPRFSCTVPARLNIP